MKTKASLLSGILILLGFSMFLGLLSCTRPKGSTSKNESSGERSVNLTIWSNYITPEQMNTFEQKTGIKVSVSNYSSNEELLAKLQAGASGYDIAVPSDYMVAIMKASHLLEPLEKSRLKNFKDLDPKVIHKYYDPMNEVSVPLDWGTTGIAVNRDMVKTPIKGWKDLLKNPEITGKFTMLDDVRESLGAALKAEALSLNSTNASELEKARGNLVSLKARVKGFTSETKPGLINGEMAVAQAYSCDAGQASKETGGKIQFVIPEEGGTLWIDNMVIPKGAKHISEALLLIDYLLSPEVQAARADSIRIAPTNKLAYTLLPKELRDLKTLFPDDSTLAKMEMIKDLGKDLSRWDRIWTEVKATQ